MTEPGPRTRFAPSPTGYLHIGGARTALFSWLYARRHGGTFILRIEDTDRERSTEAAVQAILEGMDWLGLGYDEGPYFQTARYERYRAVIEQLIREDKAYYCDCSKERLETLRSEQLARKEKPRYDGRCRARTAAGTMRAVRFKNPEDGAVVVDDRIRGQVVFQNCELDDLIIARSDGNPTYNFTVVVDDRDMLITHVIRGDDHLNNTPRQINILRALGAEVPRYAHVPMILAADGKRLSKRHGAVSVLQYRDEGYLPQALLNYLVRLGWSHGDQEVFSLEELVENFDLADVNRSAAVFNPAKLLWLNQHYLKTVEAAEITRRLAPYLAACGVKTPDEPPLARVIEPLRERSKTLVEMAQGARFFYREVDTYDAVAAERYLTHETAGLLGALREGFAVLPQWQKEALHAAVGAVAARFDLKLGQVAQPLRVALCGGTVSPPIDVTAELLGRDRTLQRISRAMSSIASRR
ncbi:MAG: glutamate--tRNA ligase [Gammaproteobacteria bacterium]